MKISVTREDIESGERQNCTACPLARAIQRALPGYTVAVSETITIFDSGEVVYDDYTWEVSVAADNFWQDFDAGKPVEPFEFELPFEPKE